MERPIITALTAQNTQGVTGVHAVPPAFIGLQADTLAADIEVTAVKTGCSAMRSRSRPWSAFCRSYEFGPIVVDPVMVATSGDVLLAPDAIAAVRNLLVPLATLITPNLHEAAQLLGTSLASTVEEMEAQAQRLVAGWRTRSARQRRSRHG